MKLIFDCTALSKWEGRTTGIQRVISEIGRSLPKHIPGVELAILSPKNGGWLRYHLESRSIGEAVEVVSGDLIFTAGHNWDHPEHFQALIGYTERGVQLGTLYYDIIPILFPFTYGPGFVPLFETWLQESLQRSACAFAISESSARDVAAYSRKHGYKTPQVHTLRLGDDLPGSDEVVSDRIAEKTSVRYILSVGTIEYRKNHNLLLDTWRYMIDDLGVTPPNLYIVGRLGWLHNDIPYQLDNDPRLAGRVAVLSDLSDADLKHLYQNALFTVYPSIYEGWGLPIAESLGFGKVCVASNTSSMVEIAPGLVRFAHPRMVSEWAEQISELSENPDVLAAEEARIAAEYSLGTWEQSAAQLARGLIAQYPELGE